MEPSASKERNSALDAVKIVISIVLVSVAIVGNSLFESEPFLYRLGGVIVLIGAGVLLALSTSRGLQFRTLVKDSRVELKRVVWPTKQETWSTSAIVLVVVVVSALILWGIDYLLGSSVSFLMG
ncbi:Protein translocase subunit [gamma proteobacterium HdN1]|nr:Protein translocase subunit [gamma proteobacterium HdN1]